MTLTSSFSKTVIGVLRSSSLIVSSVLASSDPVQYTSMCTVRDLRLLLSSFAEVSDFSESAGGPELVVLADADGDRISYRNEDDCNTRDSFMTNCRTHLESRDDDLPPFFSAR